MDSDAVLEYFTESRNISFLHDPKSYYNQLCTMFKNAKEKIVISCLYIGTFKLEQDLVDCIVSAKKNRPDLIVEILLDKQRSIRKESNGKCFLDLIKDLVKEKNVKIMLYHSPLCDGILNKLVKPPYSEVLGTLHMKIYVADNKTIITGANCSTPYFSNRMDRYMVLEDELFSKVMHTIVSTVSTMAFKVNESLDLVWESDLVNPLEDYLLFKKQIYKRLVTMIRMCNDELELLLMDKVKYYMEQEEKKNRTGSIFSKLKRKKSLYTSSIMSNGSQNSIGSGRSTISSTRTSITNNGTNLLTERVLEYSNSIETSRENELEEVMVKKTLSGNYVLSPTSTINGTSRSLLSSRSNLTTFRSMNSGRSEKNKKNEQKENCELCNSYEEMQLDDIEYTPKEIMRRYPPMEGYTRFMIFFQMGFSEPPMRTDELISKDLMIKYRKTGHTVVLATSYLNFTKDYSDLCTYLLNCKTRENMGSFYVLTSSPTSNDFNNATGSKKLIPKAYSHYQGLLLDYVFKKSKKKVKDSYGDYELEGERGNVGKGIEGGVGGRGQGLGDREGESEGEGERDKMFYYEYQNPGHTFHHKGIWMIEGKIPENVKKLTFEEFKKNIKGPCAMIIGSSNLSRRSHLKDLEMTMVVETNSMEVLDPLKYEVYSLFANSEPMSHKAVSKRMNLVLRPFAFFLRQYF